MGEPAITEEAIARASRVVHETIRAWQAANGQDAAPPWSRAPAWQKKATAAGIRFRLDHPDAPSSAQHDQWMADKRADGWVHGAVKDPAAKTHPLLVPYDQLPEVERRKDALFGAVVRALLTDAL